MTRTIEREVYRKLKFPPTFTDLYCKGKKDSLDYAGELGEIAFVGNHTKGVSIWVVGDTCFIAPDGTKFANRTAESEGYNKDEVKWDMNNWFEHELVKDGRYLNISMSVEYNLDRAIQKAMDILEDPNYWKEE